MPYYPPALTEEQMQDVFELAGWHVTVSRGLLKDSGTWFVTISNKYDCISTWGDSRNEAIRNAFDNFIREQNGNHAD